MKDMKNAKNMKNLGETMEGPYIGNAGKQALIREKLRGRSGDEAPEDEASFKGEAEQASV